MAELTLLLLGRWKEELVWLHTNSFRKLSEHINRWTVQASLKEADICAFDVSFMGEFFL